MAGIDAQKRKAKPGEVPSFRLGGSGPVFLVEVKGLRLRRVTLNPFFEQGDCNANPKPLNLNLNPLTTKPGRSILAPQERRVRFFTVGGGPSLCSPGVRIAAFLIFGLQTLRAFDSHTRTRQARLLILTCFSGRGL